MSGESKQGELEFSGKRGQTASPQNTAMSSQGVFKNKLHAVLLTVFHYGPALNIFRGHARLYITQFHDSKLF